MSRGLSKTMNGYGLEAAKLCPVRGVLGGVSSKWSMLLVLALEERPHRFGEIHRTIPDISKKMLSQTLRDLERDGFIGREVLPTKPPSVEYALTPLGRSMLGPLWAFVGWAGGRRQEIEAARARFDAQIGLSR